MILRNLSLIAFECQFSLKCTSLSFFFLNHHFICEKGSNFLRRPIRLIRDIMEQVSMLDYVCTHFFTTY